MNFTTLFSAILVAFFVCNFINAVQCAAQEQKQHTLMRCKACIDASARITEMMETVPLGEVVRTMHGQAADGDKKKAKKPTNEAKTRLARAYEIVEAACDDARVLDVEESQLDLTTLCKDVVNEFEDDFVDFVKKDGKGAKVSMIQDVCLPVCEMRRKMKKTIDDMTMNFKKSRGKLMEEVIEILRENWLTFMAIICVLAPLFTYIQMSIYGGQLAAAAKKKQ